jgi:hypothetical protein
MSEERLWQEDCNSVWKTNIRPTCNICNNQSDNVVEIKVHENDIGLRACFMGDCMRKGIKRMHDENPDEAGVWLRLIGYDNRGD